MQLIKIISDVTTVTEVRRASFALVLHAHQIFANSFNFLVTWHCTSQQCSSIYVCMYRLFAGMWRPLVSVITTLYYVTIIFHHRVRYCALSLHYVSIQSSGIILIPYATFVPNFISFAASSAALANGEKLHTRSLNHSLTQLI